MTDTALLDAIKRVIRWLDNANCCDLSVDELRESMRQDLNELRRAANAATPSGEVVTVPEWISVKNRLPEVKQGGHDTFLVACRRAHSGETYVFQAVYLNGYLLSDTRDEEIEKPFTGWYDTKDHSDYDEYFEPIDNVAGDEVTHWMPLPAAPKFGTQPEDKATNNGGS